MIQAHWYFSSRHLQQLASAGVAADEAAPEEDAVVDCASIKGDSLRAARQTMEKWEKAANAAQIIGGYGNKAARFLNQTLTNFDESVRKNLGQEPVACSAERKALQENLEKQLYAIFLAQSSSVEQVLYQKLRKNLLRRLRRKKGELNIKEKLKMLHAATAEYDEKVADLQPFFVTDSGHDRAEQRLSELQWGVEQTPEAKEMMNRWNTDRMRRAMGGRKTPSLSMPGMGLGWRLMLRPDALGGLGGFQMNARRETATGNEYSFGVLNDGKVADIYNDKEKPQFAKFQPIVALELRLTSS